MFISGKDGRPRFPFLVAIETDPARMPMELGGRPRMLDQGDAEQLLAHLTADIGNVLGGIRKCHLVASGALFDQCQVLRPALPVFEALSGLLGDSAAEALTPGQTALGARDGAMPLEDLSPDPGIPPAVLLLLPMVIAGPEGLIRELAEEMEHRFLGEGQVSAHTASWMEAAFGIGISHARFMTLTDLNAMFRLQLEHFGYLPLWDLTDAAVFERNDPLLLEAPNGMRMRWCGTEAHIEFQTFNYWAHQGSGKDVSADGLGEAYAEWSRELRRYTSTLAAHRVPLRFDLPDNCQGEVSENYLCEDAEPLTANQPMASITEHSRDDLGIIAITVQSGGRLKHFYPLTPGGLNEIHDHIQNLELRGEGMSFPGKVACCESTRALRPGYFNGGAVT